MNPSELKYTETHEWLHLEGNKCTGITPRSGTAGDYRLQDCRKKERVSKGECWETLNR